MKEDTGVGLKKRVVEESRSALDEVLRKGARELLQAAIEGEVAEYINKYQDHRDKAGYRWVVRNGSMPQRELVTGVGSIRIKQPRVYDRRDGQRFTSQLLPPFMRRVPSIDALIPVLYLKGISTGDFSEALESILGENAVGLSPANIVSR